MPVGRAPFTLSLEVAVEIRVSFQIFPFVSPPFSPSFVVVVLNYYFHLTSLRLSNVVQTGLFYSNVSLFLFILSLLFLLRTKKSMANCFVDAAIAASVQSAILPF